MTRTTCIYRTIFFDFHEIDDEYLIQSLKQIDYRTEDVERKLHGDGPWTIGSDFELIYTPGHTEVRHFHNTRKLSVCVWVGWGNGDQFEEI
jgi:hypothetical protein